MNDEKWMSLALSLAKQASDLGEVPVGAVICKDDMVVSAAYNRREIDNNATSHAEVLAINDACKKLGGWRLESCTLYVTLEPCPMCVGAIINSRISRVVYGAGDTKSGCLGSLVDMRKIPFNHKFDVTSGIMEKESADLLKSFFAALRNKRKQN